MLYVSSVTLWCGAFSDLLLPGSYELLYVSSVALYAFSDLLLPGMSWSHGESFRILTKKNPRKLKGTKEISVANMIRAEVLLKVFWCIARLYLKPGSFPKGLLQCCFSSVPNCRRSSDTKFWNVYAYQTALMAARHVCTRFCLTLVRTVWKSYEN